MKSYPEYFQDSIDMTDGSAVIYEKDYVAIQSDARKELEQERDELKELGEHWRLRWAEEHHSICEIGNAVFKQEKDGWDHNPVARETIKALQERDTLQRTLETRMLESKLIEHILDGDEGWRTGIQDTALCPTMQSAVKLRNEFEALQRSNAELEQKCYQLEHGKYNAKYYALQAMELSAQVERLRGSLRTIRDIDCWEIQCKQVARLALSLTPSDALKEYMIDARRSIAELSAQVERLAEALRFIRSHLQGSEFDGDRPSCLTVIATQAINLTPSDALKEIRIEILRYAIGIVDGRRVLNRTPDYIAALDEIKIFLEASVERVSAGESMHATAVTQAAQSDALKEYMKPWVELAEHAIRNYPGQGIEKRAGQLLASIGK